MAATRRLAAIMFTDLAGFTASAQADEASALTRLHEQEELVRPVFADYGGREIKSTGDGSLVEFDSAVKATECAIEIQRRLHERNSEKPRSPIELRIGLHVGDVEERKGDIFGDAVNVASRIVTLAEPGGVCLSGQVFDHVRNKVSEPLEKVGPRNLKGVRDSIEVYRVAFRWPGTGPEPGISPFPRLAVLPLTNISPDPKDEYFADGLTEELISALSQIRGLRVIARTSVGQYKSTSKSISQIGSELGVGSILEGSVRKAGNRLRIALQLVDVASQEHKWAQSFNRDLDDVFSIQSEIAEHTATALRLELVRPGRESTHRPSTPALTAYELYLQGIAEYHKTGAVGGAARLFEAAIREDPNFSLPYSHLANVLIQGLGENFPARDVIPRARELVQKALELDPDSSEAHAARGNFAMQGEHDWKLAEAEFRRALELNPSSAVSHGWYGVLLETLQRFDEAIRQYRLAMELDPALGVIRIRLSTTHLRAGDTASAILVLRKTSEDFPREPPIHALLARAYLAAGREADAEREMERALEFLEDPDALESDRETTLEVRSLLLARQGKTQEVRQFLQETVSKSRRRYVPLTEIARLQALLGETEAALETLEQDERGGDRALWFVYQKPEFDSIRDHPRFRALLRNANLPETRPSQSPSSRPDR